MIKRFLITHKVVFGSAVFIILSALFVGGVLIKTNKDKSYTYKIEARKSDYKNLYVEKTQIDKPTTGTPDSTKPSTQKPTTQTAPKPTNNPSTPNTCPSLEKAVSDKEYSYLDTANKYISTINKDIYDRYDSRTNSYSDLDTVRVAVSYANYALDSIYSEMVNNFNVQKGKGCNYKKILSHFYLPDVSDYPNNWGFDAQDAVSSSYGS